ncbi:unnamed protein product [Porites lobata]|uniref:Cytochrome P450 n=1 Tax=Porites lobata TaxID=104759 RepID=A0ABN8NFC1_9CNID|nr:unnamed protein product [Porites lobata]
MLFSCEMDDSLYLFCSGLVIAALIWLFNPFGKLESLMGCLLNSRSAKLPDGVRSFDDMPGPWGWPFFGDIFSYLKDADFKQQIAKLKSNFAKYGPIYKRTILGRNVVLIQDPKDVETVIKADGRCPMRPKQSLLKAVEEYSKSRGIPKGLIVREGEDWNRMRKALAPKMLRPKDVRDNMDNFTAVTRDALEHMVSIRGIDMEIPDLDKELAKWATESVGTMAFDVRVGLYDDPPNKDTVKMVQATLDAFALMGKLGRGWENLCYMFFTTPTYRKFCEATDTSFAMSQKIVDNKVAELNKMAEEGGRFDDNQSVSLLTYLLMKGELTPEEINMNSIGMFRAGVDTTSNAMLWLLYDLANNPKVQERVYEEVLSLIGPHGDFNSENFAKLQYIKACVKESMRLHPIASGWARLLNQDVVISGYNVPANTVIVYNNYLSGRSEELFKFPLEYRPERWLNEDLGKIHPFASLPFGVGPRMCIGRRIAEAEIYLLAAKIVQRFILEYQGEPASMKFRLLAVPDRTLKIKFIDRQ